MEFIKPRRKRSFKERHGDILELLNKNGQVSWKDLVKKWQVTPTYAKSMLRWAHELNSFTEYDMETDTLFLKERKLCRECGQQDQSNPYRVFCPKGMGERTLTDTCAIEATQK